MIVGVVMVMLISVMVVVIVGGEVEERELDDEPIAHEQSPLRENAHDQNSVFR